VLHLLARDTPLGRDVDHDGHASRAGLGHGGFDFRDRLDIDELQAGCGLDLADCAAECSKRNGPKRIGTAQRCADQHQRTVEAGEYADTLACPLRAGRALRKGLERTEKDTGHKYEQRPQYEYHAARQHSVHHVDRHGDHHDAEGSLDHVHPGPGFRQQLAGGGANDEQR